MTNDERASLEVLRAEMNGKLDLLLERTSDLRESRSDHELRIRDLEEHGSVHAQEAVDSAKAAAIGVREVKTRLAYMSGAVAVLVAVANFIWPALAHALGIAH